MKVSGTLAALVLGLAALSAANGMRPPGWEGVRAWRGWWETRRFERSLQRGELGLLLEQAERIWEWTGNPDPYLHAVYRIGVEGSAPARTPDANTARSHARRARRALDSRQPYAPDPLEWNLLRALLLSQRLLPLARGTVESDAYRKAALEALRRVAVLGPDAREFLALSRIERRRRLQRELEAVPTVW